MSQQNEWLITSLFVEKPLATPRSFNYEKNKEWVFEGKVPAIIDFYADWCVACLEFEKFTFTDKEVKAIMKQYILLKADVTNNNLNDKELMKKFNIFGPPAIIFFNSAGVEIRQIRTIGFKNPKEFKKILQIGLNKWKRILNFYCYS